jgi:NADH dehydrogenase (ubiquinone) Fe-S protein 1
MNNLKKLAIQYKVITEETKWNGLNVLHNYASTVTACDIGIPQYLKGDLKEAKVVYILGHDDFRDDDIPEDAKVIYQGCVGDEGVYYADLILPGAAYTEK